MPLNTSSQPHVRKYCHFFDTRTRRKRKSARKMSATRTSKRFKTTCICAGKGTNVRRKKLMNEMRASRFGQRPRDKTTQRFATGAPVRGLNLCPARKQPLGSDYHAHDKPQGG